MSDRFYADTPTNNAGFEDAGTVVRNDTHIHRRISWAAIFGGVILAVVVQLLLSTLGAGIGFGTVNVNAGTTPDSSTLGLGAGIWWIISSCIALGVGGFAAAWMAGIEIRIDGVMHGLITWGFATLLAVYLLGSTAGTVVRGGFSAVGSITSAAGGGLGAVAKPLTQAAGISPDMIQEQAQAFLKPTNPDAASMSPQDAQKEVVTQLATFAKGGADAEAAKTRVVDIMAAQMKISREEASKRFDDAQAKLKQARDQAVQTAKDAADASAAAASTASFAAFGLLLLGGVAASVGGMMAVQRRTHAVRHVVR